MAQVVRGVDTNQDTDDSTGAVSFSVRLTGKQRDLLARAAEKRGWTLTSLLKSAALEKAVHILNTSVPNKVDFRGTAEEIARQVFSPRSGRLFDFSGEEPEPVSAHLYEHLEDAILDQDTRAVEVSHLERPPKFLTNIREAAKFGGTEFLDLIVEAAEAITTRNKPDLPDPIDPSSI